MRDKCLVILSGGADSTICLAWAKTKFKEVHAVTFNYGQKHAIEIESAVKVAQMLGVASHEIVELGPILKSTSPLVSNNPVGRYASPDQLPGGVEPTFVPCRNPLFLVVAANRATALGIIDLVTGVAQEDYGGYPDCRQPFVDAMSLSLSRALYGDDDSVRIHTPLMNLTKKQSVELAQTLPGAMEALAFSHTCYNGCYPPDPLNHSSMLRARGFHEAGVSDPLIERAKHEGLLPMDYPPDGYVVGTKYVDEEFQSVG